MMEPPPPYDSLSSSPAFPPKIPIKHEAVPQNMPSAPLMEDVEDDRQEDRQSNVFVHEPTLIEVDPRLTRRNDATTAGGVICVLLLLIALAVMFLPHFLKKHH